MSITNTARPIANITNIARVSNAELWSTIITTWASETRTWLALGSLMTNGTRPAASITNIARPS